MTFSLQEHGLVICTEASAQVGMGHFMRCLALAEAWQETGHDPLFLMPDPPDNVIGILQQKQIFWRTISSLNAIAEISHLAKSSAWLVLDSYQILSQTRQTLHNLGYKMLWIDDLGATDEPCVDLIVNPHLYAHAHLYPALEQSENLLAGPDYLLFRREFRHASGRQQVEKTESRPMQLCLMMGGTDPAGANLTLLKLIKDWFLKVLPDGLKVVVVTTTLNPKRLQIQALIDTLPFPVQLEIEPPHLLRLMQTSHLAITTPSGSAWECALMGIPFLTLTVADNQRNLGDSLDKAGVSRSLGELGKTPLTEIASRFETFMSLFLENSNCLLKNAFSIDGQGCERIFQRMGVTPFRLSPMRIEDAEVYWHMSNDPAVRAMSFHSDPIPWETHLNWLKQKLASEEHEFYLILDESQEPAGVLRFEPTSDPETGLVGILLAAHVRGKGWSSQVIRAGVERIWWKKSWQTIQAWIKPENQASLSAFTKAGFKRVSEHEPHSECIKMKINRTNRNTYSHDH